MPVAGRKLSVEEAIALCFRIGFREGGLRTAVALMTAESGRYVEAYNINASADGQSRSLDRGLFQINTIHIDNLGMAESFKAVPNASYAFDLSLGGSNFTPWSAYNSGAYEQFMRTVRIAWGRTESWKPLVATIFEDLA